MENALGQIIECRLVGNIYDQKRDAEIKKANQETQPEGKE